MLTDEERDYLGRVTRVMQIIVAAMVAGTASFFGVVLLMEPPPGAALGDRRLTYISAAIGFLAPAVAAVLPRLVLRKHRQAMLVGNAAAPAAAKIPALPDSLREVGAIAAGYQTALIIRCALIEGAAFFSLVAFMFERQTLSLVVAGALLLALASCFPTRSRVEEAVETERREIEQLRPMEPTDAR